MNKFEIVALNYYIKRCTIFNENPTIEGFKEYYYQYKYFFSKIA